MKIMLESTVSKHPDFSSNFHQCFVGGAEALLWRPAVKQSTGGEGCGFLEIDPPVHWVTSENMSSSLGTKRSTENRFMEAGLAKAAKLYENGSWVRGLWGGRLNVDENTEVITPAINVG